MATESRDADALAGSIEEHPPQPERQANRTVPDAVSRRFLRIDDRYFFPDRTLAFVDQGTRLKVRTHNLEVVHSVVAIMQARGWQVVRVTGTREFRQKVWHEAGLQDIKVQGYAPSELEQQQLRHAVERIRRVRHDAHETPAANAHSPDRQPSDERRPSPDGLRPPVTGVLLAHAAAPYRFDPTQRMSYYARVRTELGERTLWGADLERALAESRSDVRIGDEVVVRQRGARPVTVRVADRDGDGQLRGDKKIVTQRMAWTVDKPEFLEALSRKAEILRNPESQAGAVLAEYPDLAGPLAGLMLAERFARRVTHLVDDQVRLVRAIRDTLADAIARGERVTLPSQRTRPADFHHRARTAPNFDDPVRDHA